MVSSGKFFINPKDPEPPVRTKTKSFFFSKKENASDFLSTEGQSIVFTNPLPSKSLMRKSLYPSSDSM